MTRIATTLLAASAFALSATVASACPFMKNNTTASYEGEMTTIEQSTAMTKKPATATTEALATSDVAAPKTPKK